jgi:hypothetical protein
MQGFLLGLANGVSCLSNCAPVLLPLILAGGLKVTGNCRILGAFLGGRLCGYLLFSLAAWATNRLIFENLGHRSLVFGATYTMLSSLMIYYALSSNNLSCAGSSKGLRASLLKKPAFFPAGMGFLTGVSPCPPFLLAFAGAAASGSLGGSLLFFFTFFLGTAIYFIPFPFLGFFGNFTALRTVGRFAAVIVALYFFYLGVLSLSIGIGNL